MHPDKKLEEITNFIDSNYANEIKHFSIESYGGGPEESFISANKAGLIIFAGMLLDAATQFDEENEQKTMIGLDLDANWIHGETIIEFVKPVYKVEEILRIDKQNRFFGIASRFGCIVVVIMLFIAICVGIFTILQWLF